MAEMLASWERLRREALEGTEILKVSDPEELERVHKAQRMSFWDLLAENPRAVARGLGKVAELGVATMAPGISDWISAKEALTGENITGKLAGEEARELSLLERALAAPGVLPILPSIGLMTKAVGVTKLWEGMLAGTPRLPGGELSQQSAKILIRRLADALTVPERNWGHIEDITTKAGPGGYYMAPWKGQKVEINVDPTKGTIGTVGHEFGHDEWYFPQGKFEERVTKALHPVHEALLREREVLGKAYWDVSPAEQTSIILTELYDKVYEAGRIPEFHALYRRALAEAPYTAFSNIQETSAMFQSTQELLDEAAMTITQFLRGEKGL